MQPLVPDYVHTSESLILEAAFAAALAAKQIAAAGCSQRDCLGRSL